VKFKKPSKSALIISAAIMLAVFIAAGFLIHWVVTSTAVSRKNTSRPMYETILPTGKTIDELGGWQRVTPNGTDPVFAYTDNVEGVTISVSQQPLPDSFKQNTDARIGELAKAYVPTDVDGVKVYIGTSSKGPQSLIFTKNGLLINIKSEQKVSEAGWINYVKSLSNRLGY